MQQKQLGVSGRIYGIEQVRAKQAIKPGQGQVLKLKVNFMPEIITLSKEVRTLKYNLSLVMIVIYILQANVKNRKISIDVNIY